MALVQCADCGREMSLEADACPVCGKPNIRARNRGQDNKQKVGCAVMVLALLLMLVLPPALAGVLFFVGLVLMLLNTRFS